MVKKASPGGLAWTNEEDLATVLANARRDQLLAFAEAIRTFHPAAELGDITLMEVHTRPNTGDATNLKILLDEATGVFNEIAGGARDKDIEEVFGKRNTQLVRRKYANAKKAGEKIIKKDKIISDRSGFSEEVGLGGYYFKGEIKLLASIIDNPKSPVSVVTFMHECAHAGNNDVDDYGYITSDPLFTRQTEDYKLKNAAHYEVAPRRKYRLEPSFTGIAFLPADAARGASAPLTSAEEALQCAGETFRKAWDRGVDVHERLLEVARHPRRWYTRPWIRGGLLSWSRISKLTIHDRRSTFPPTWSEGFSPVSHLDIALSEGVVRKVDLAQSSVPKGVAAADTFVQLFADLGEKAELTGTPEGLRSAKQCALIVKLVLRTRVTNMTGSLASDMQLVNALAADYRT